MATIRQQIAAKEIVGNGGSVSDAMRVAGYSENTIKTPSKLTASEGWKELMETHLSDEELAKKHKELLNSSTLDHMVFPTGPKDEPVGMLPEQREKVMTDQDIKDLLLTVNCTVRRIVHSENQRHVYFWSADNRARKDALDMAFKLKGKYAPEKSVNINIELDADPTVKDLTIKLNALYGGAGVTGDGGLASALDPETQDQERVW